MDIEASFDLTPVSWHLNGFTSEILGLIASFSDAWDVSRLYCCGDVKLNKLLESPSGVHSIRHVSLDKVKIALPGFISALKGLKSLAVLRKGEELMTATLSPSSAALLPGLAENLEELVLWQVANVDCLVSEEKFLCQNLTSLVLNSEPSVMSTIVSDLPPQLTSLDLYLPDEFQMEGMEEDDLPTLPLDFLANLPTSLTSLHLEGELRFDLRDSWPARLPSLTSLKLITPSHGICYDLPTLSSLPSSLTCLHLRSEFFGIPPESEEEEDQASLIHLLPPTLVDLCLGFECDSPMDYSQSLSELRCWDSMRRLQLTHLYGLPPTLPPKLESLSISAGEVPDLSGLPSASLKSLELDCEEWNDSKGLAAISLPKLENLSFTSISMVLEKARDIPPSVTRLQVDREIAPLLLDLPKHSLRIVVEKEIWTWIRVKELGKFFFKDMKLPTQNGVDSDPTSPVPYSGYSGSGWTCIGHAIELDSVLLLKEILRVMPSLWQEAALEIALNAAIEFQSWKILAWFEKQHFLPIWRNLETSDFGRLIVSTAAKNRPEVAKWLLERGFTRP
jgi:hypothetical protein